MPRKPRILVWTSSMGSNPIPWTQISITKDIDTLCHSFSLTIDGHDGDMPNLTGYTARQDSHAIEIRHSTDTADVYLFRGMIDKAVMSAGKGGKKLTLSGRSMCSLFVDSHVQDVAHKAGESVFDTINKLAYRLAQDGAELVHVEAAKEADTDAQPVAEITTSSGDSYFDLMNMMVKQTGMSLTTDDLSGGILLVKGASRFFGTHMLIEGRNILDWSVSDSPSTRAAKYIAIESGVIGEDATDEDEFGRAGVVKVFSSVSSSGSLMESAEWRNKRNASRSHQVSITVQGVIDMTEGTLEGVVNGQSWAVNTVAYLEIPSAGVRGHYLITGVTQSVSASGEQTALTLEIHGARE